MASVPELDFGYRLIGTKHGIFFCWFCPAGTRERKLWRAYQYQKKLKSDTVKGSFLVPAAVDMGFRAILDILKTDDFDEFKEEMGLKASILKVMAQRATMEMGDVLRKLQLPAIRRAHILYVASFSIRKSVCSGYRMAQSASCFHDDMAL